MANAACAAALCGSEPMNASMNTPPTFIAIPWMPVGPESMVTRERHDPCAAPQLPKRVPSDKAGRDRRAHRRTLRAERWNWSEPTNQDDVEDEVQHRHRDAEHHRRARVA